MSENVKTDKKIPSKQELQKRAMELKDHYKSENALLFFEKENASLLADIEEAKYKEMLFKVKTAELYSQMQDMQHKNTKTTEEDVK